MAFFCYSELDAALAALLGGGPFTTCNMGLFTNNVTFNQATTLGSLTEASYSGYTKQAVTPWGAPSGGSGGTSTAAGTPCVFNPGVIGSPQDCYGWFIVDGSGNLVGGDNFSGGPLNMGGTVPSVAITPSVVLTS